MILTEIGGGGGGQDVNVNVSLKKGCKNWILTIKDNIAHPRLYLQHSSSSDVGVILVELLEVFLSGALHGDKSVGPTVVVEISSFSIELACWNSIIYQP